MVDVKTTIGAGGRVVIPAEHRKKLGMKSGDEVIVALEHDEVRILTPAAAIRRAQALVRRYVPKERSLAAELIRERREESPDG